MINFRNAFQDVTECIAASFADLPVMFLQTAMQIVLLVVYPSKRIVITGILPVIAYTQPPVASNMLA
jgi:hypothetical protein